MTIPKLLEQHSVQKIGKKPVVVLPLEIWREIENRFEDLEMSQSNKFRKKIAKARLEKRLHSSSQVKKLLSL